MIALVRTVGGVFELDVETEDVLGEVDAAVERELPELGLPRLIAAAATGATVPSFVVSFALAYAIAALGQRRF